MKQYDPECCHVMDFDGWGSHWFCCGALWFVSATLKEWSDMRNKNRGEGGNPYVVTHEDNVGGGQNSTK